MQKTLLTILGAAALTALPACTISERTMKSPRPIQATVETTPKTQRYIGPIPVPGIVDNDGVQQVAPHKQTQYDIPTEIIHGELYAAVPNRAPTNEELLFGMKWVNKEGHLRFNYTDRSARLTSEDREYIPTRVKDDKGNGVEHIKFETDGAHGIRARVILPKFNNLELGTYNVQEGNIIVELDTLRIKDPRNPEEIYEYFVPAASKEVVQAFYQEMSEGKRPQKLPFFLVPINGTEVDVEVETGQVTLYPYGKVFQPTVETIEEDVPVAHSSTILTPPAGQALEMRFMEIEAGKKEIQIPLNMHGEVPNRNK